MNMRVMLVTATTLVLALVGGTPSASAGGKKDSKSTATTSSLPDPSKYEFVVEKDEPLPGWEAMHIKGAPEKEGFITYQIIPNTDQVVINMVKGIKGQPGAGEALKREVLKRYPPKMVKSELTSTNRERLLAAWGKDFPKHPNLASLKSTVPAMKFEGFNYEIDTDGKRILLTMTPGNGKVEVKDAGKLDAVLLSESPEKEEKKADKKDDKKDDKKKNAKKKS